VSFNQAANVIFCRGERCSLQCGISS